MPMMANPYPRAKEHIPRMTLCELCNRSLPTKDWPGHKNSKKHRQAEAKERGDNDNNNANEFANAANEFGFGDAFTTTNTSGNDAWGSGDGFTSYNTNSGGGDSDRACFGCGETGHQKRDCPKGSGGQACYNCGETG
jgi:hypothetical protein